MAKGNAVKEFNEAPEGTYAAKDLLNLADRLIREQKGLSSLDVYSLYVLSNGDDVTAVMSGIAEIRKRYWRGLGKEPPELTGDYV